MAAEARCTQPRCRSSSDLEMSRTAAGGHHAGRNRMQTSRAGTKLTRSNYHIRVEPFKWVETAC